MGDRRDAQYRRELMRRRCARFGRDNDAVDVVALEAGVADGGDRRVRGEPGRRSSGVAAEAGRADTDDRDLILGRIARHDVTARGRAGGGAKCGEGHAVAIDPRELDRHADGDVLDGAVDDGAREAQRRLFDEFDCGDRVGADAVVDAGRGRALMQQHEQVDRAPSADLGGAQVVRPAVGADGLRRMVPLWHESQRLMSSRRCNQPR